MVGKQRRERKGRREKEGYGKTCFEGEKRALGEERGERKGEEGEEGDVRVIVQVCGSISRAQNKNDITILLMSHTCDEAIL